MICRPFVVMFVRLRLVALSGYNRLSVLLFCRADRVDRYLAIENKSVSVRCPVSRNLRKPCKEDLR